MTERQKGIGGSDVAAILEKSEWKTPYDIWLEKVNGQNITLSKRMAWGLILEDAIIRRWAEIQNRQILERGAFWKKDWIQSHIDALGVDAKSTDKFTFSQKWGEEFTDEVPEDYYYQAFWYMVTGKLLGKSIDFWEFAVMIDTNFFRDNVEPFPLSVKADGEYFFEDTEGKYYEILSMIARVSEIKVFRVYWNNDEGNRIYNAAKKFWFGHVQKNTPPPITKPVKKEYKYESTLLPKIDIKEMPELAGEINQLVQISYAGKVLESRADQIKARVKEKIQLHAGIFGEDWSISFANPKEPTRKKIDFESIFYHFRAQHPEHDKELTEYLKRWTKESPNERRFFPNFKKLYLQIENYMAENQFTINLNDIKQVEGVLTDGE